MRSLITGVTVPALCLRLCPVATIKAGSRSVSAPGVMFEGGSEGKEERKERGREGERKGEGGKENESRNSTGEGKLREVMQACLPQEESPLRKKYRGTDSKSTAKKRS